LQFRTTDDLKPYADLDAPVWVFDVSRHAMWWANPRALTFWSAQTVAALAARDFSDDSGSVRERLRQIVQVKRPRAEIRERWTLYPAGVPVATVLSARPARIENKRDAVLFEVLSSGDLSPDDEFRRVTDAMRASRLLISTYALDGTLLAQSLSTETCYGPRPAPPETCSLADRLLMPQAARELLHAVKRDISYSAELTVLTREGPRTHVVTARRGRDPVTGEFVAIVTEEDVTEQAMIRDHQTIRARQLEGTIAERTDRLRASERRYKLASQTAGIWEWDMVKGTFFASPGFAETLGYTPGEMRELLRDKGILTLFAPEDQQQFKDLTRSVLADPSAPISQELRFLSKSGAPRWHHAQGKVVVDRKGQPVSAVGVSTDITDRKTLELSLMAAQRLEAIGQLTGGIAHDFNNLLTVIQGNAELMELAGGHDPELTGAVIAAVQRGAALTSHLLAFARRQTLKPRTVLLGDLLGTLRNTLLRTLSETVELEFEVGAEIWPIYVDPVQMESAILNIAINARDAMPEGGRLVLTCRNRQFDAPPRGCELELTAGSYVEIALTDTGHGMDAESLAKAFEPFFTTKDVGRGSGLGLSMVLGFSRQSGGDALIRSAPGGGTTVSLFLPRAEGAPDRPETQRPADPLRGNGEHIHVLEDNPEVRRALIRILISLNYRVSGSERVDAALEAARAPLGDPPDLYLADVVLPHGRSGTDFARAIAAGPTPAPVILMSGYPDSQFAASEEVGAVAFLSKPIDSATLAEAIDKALRARRPKA
jgi:PAS domain S-box-containing protein